MGGNAARTGDEKCIKFWSENLKERDPSEDLDTQEDNIRIDLKGRGW
jgi:hypothetical protein